MSQQLASSQSCTGFRISGFQAVFKVETATLMVNDNCSVDKRNGDKGTDDEEDHWQDAHMGETEWAGRGPGGDLGSSREETAPTGHTGGTTPATRWEEWFSGSEVPGMTAAVCYLFWTKPRLPGHYHVGGFSKGIQDTAVYQSVSTQVLHWAKLDSNCDPTLSGCSGQQTDSGS
eukprot:3621701-Rhodomonas_salina.1